MAETIKELQIKYSADTSEVGTGTETAKTSLLGLTAGIGAGIIVLNQFQQLMGTASRALRELASATMEAVNAFAEFSEGMAEVSTLIDATDAQMAELSAGVMELSGQFGARQTEQTRALYNAISAGAADASNSVDFLTDANRAAIAGVTDVDSAVRVLAGTINAYGLNTEDAARVSDILFSTVREGVLTFSDLAGGLGRVTSVAATAGISLEELTAALATLTKSGLRFDEAVTSLRQIIITFITPTKDAKEVAEGLGIELSAAALKSQGLGGALADVAAKAGDNTEALAKMFGNVRAFTGAAALAGKQADEFARIIKENEDSAGATQEAYRKMADEVAFTFRQIRAEWENFKITVGQELEPLIRLVGETILDLLRDISAFIKDNREEIDALVESIGKAGRAIGAVAKFGARRIPVAGEAVALAERMLLGPRGEIDEKEATRQLKSVLGSFGNLIKTAPLFSKSFEEDMKRVPAIIDLAAQSVKDRLAAMGSASIAEFKKVTDGFGKEWQKRVKIAGTQLKKLVDQERAAIAEVDQLRNAQKGFLEGIADDIVNIELSGLDEVTKFRTQEALARNEAQRAAVENQKGNIEESIRLAERARDMFLQLAGEEIRVGEDVAITEKERRDIAIDGLEAVREIAVAGFEEQKEVAEDALSRIRQSIADVKHELQGLREAAVAAIDISLTISTDAAKEKIKEFAQFVRNQFAGLGVGGLAGPESVATGGGGAAKGGVVNNFNITGGDAKGIAEEIQRLQRRGALEPIGG